MSESILDSVKEAVGIEADDTDFDNEIIMDINSALMVLTQLGVGPRDKQYTITDNTNTWDEFCNVSILPMVKSDVCFRVRLMFDGASMSSGLMDVVKGQINELEWRLNVAVDTGGTSNGTE